MVQFEESREDPFSFDADAKTGAMRNKALEDYVWLGCQGGFEG